MPNPKLETYKNKATGTVYDFTDADAQSKVTATVDLLKDTTGWIGGNDLPNYRGLLSTAGVTYTRNADMSVTANGTQDGTGDGADWTPLTAPTVNNSRFKISDFPKFSNSVFSVGVAVDANITVGIWYYNSSYQYIGLQTISSGEKSLIINPPQNAVYFTPYFRVNKNKTVSNLTFYPMIIDKELFALNPSYRPYHESVELSKYNRSEANILGAKNLFPIDLNTLKAKNTTGTWSDNVYSLNNATITCTVENGYVTEITANSENPISQNTNFILFDGSNSTNLVNSLKGKELTLNGCPKNGSNTSYRMLFSTWGTLENEYDNGDGCTVDVPNNVAGMRFDVILYSGYTPNNLKFRPMIRLATDTDSDFAPYAMTNRQLTDAVTPKKLEETSTSEQAARITVPTSFHIAYAFVSLDSDKTFQCVIVKGISSRAFRFTYKASSNTEVRGYIWYDYTNSRIEVGSFMVNDVEMKNDTNMKLEVFYI